MGGPLHLRLSALPLDAVRRTGHQYATFHFVRRSGAFFTYVRYRADKIIDRDYSNLIAG
jgi:hypothetical protein